MLGSFALLFHSEGFDIENIDVEMGFLLESEFSEPLTLSDGRRLTVRDVPAVETMATLVRFGIFNDSVSCYGTLGTWIEKHQFQFAGSGWEIFIQPLVPGKEHEAVIEIQLPVTRLENALDV